MKVLYILCSTLDTGGASKAFLNLMEGMTKGGVQPICVVPDNGPFAQRLLALGYKTVVIPFKPSTYPNSANIKDKLLFFPRIVGRMILNIKATSRLKALIHSEGIELVHTNTGINNIGRFAAQQSGIRHIFHIREYGDLDFGFHHFPSESYFRGHLLDKDNYNIFITKGVMDHYNLPDAKNSQVIYDGVLKRKDSLDNRKERKYLLYAGRIEPAKGLQQLLQAYLLARQKNAEALLPLKIAGEDSNPVFASQMKTFAKEILSPPVEFLGLVHNISELMSESLVTIIPSVSEGFGFVMTEAMFNGSIVIGHNTAGTKEQFDNGLKETGEEIGFRYDTTEELADLLIQVCSMEPEKKNIIRARAFSVVNKLYSVENDTKKVLDLYKTITHRDSLVTEPVEV